MYKKMSFIPLLTSYVELLCEYISKYLKEKGKKK
jgi:hypothetical protein